ncbi:hypothetical protein BUALT_Bualt19G0069800 [Buddleja alternifolia]|uniref:Uncharacterized protein n=1 Tax=Buddleja alternifolia TaxID=168488 RepID=A0AAV6W621_9LAMI|nr:hypothetical protein BUALT_Bualt19G0069800 [Buddleja alternifolia]
MKGHMPIAKRFCEEIGLEKGQIISLRNLAGPIHELSSIKKKKSEEVFQRNKTLSWDFVWKDWMEGQMSMPMKFFIDTGLANRTGVWILNLEKEEFELRCFPRRDGEIVQSPNLAGGSGNLNKTTQQAPQESDSDGKENEGDDAQEVELGKLEAILRQAQHQATQSIQNEGISTAIQECLRKIYQSGKLPAKAQEQVAAT